MASNNNTIDTDRKLYPWGGDFTIGNSSNNVALVLLNIDFMPKQTVAIYGKLKTENIGIEKIIANVISNPNIRFVIICGGEIRGHKSGRSFICLYENGIDKNNRIIKAPGAIPYIENIDHDAIIRFQNQIELIDLIDNTDLNVINDSINHCLNTKTKSFGEPYIAIQIKKNGYQSSKDKRALHSKIMIDYLGRIEKRK